MTVAPRKNQYGLTWRHRPSPDTPDALPAKRCRCAEKGDEPWLERDIDGQLHCGRCGRDYGP